MWVIGPPLSSVYVSKNSAEWGDLFVKWMHYCARVESLIKSKLCSHTHIYMQINTYRTAAHNLINKYLTAGNRALYFFFFEGILLSLYIGCRKLY